MKRIYNDIPLQSILFQICPATHIKVYDTPHTRWWEFPDRYDDAQIIYDGEYTHMVGYQYSKPLASVVHDISISIKDGQPVMNFLICTKSDRY